MSESDRTSFSSVGLVSPMGGPWAGLSPIRTFERFNMAMNENNNHYFLYFFSTAPI